MKRVRKDHRKRTEKENKMKQVELAKETGKL